MTLMFVVVIPNLAEILENSGQEIPTFTKIIIGLSDFFVSCGFIFFDFLGIVWNLDGNFLLIAGKNYIDRLKALSLL